MSDRYFRFGIAFAAMAAVLLASTAFVVTVAKAKNGVTIDGTATPAAAAGGVPTTGTIELTEFAIAPEVTTVAVGGTLAVTNHGSVPHNLRIRGTELGTSDLNGGASEDLTLVDLEPGTYEVLCDIPGHEAAGMVASLTVGADGASTVAVEGSGTEGAGTERDASAGLDPAAMSAEMEAAMEASIGAFPAETAGDGAAVLEPTVLADGTKLFELTVDEVQWEVEPGKVVDAGGYNGIVPGPTMYVDTGDRVTIRVINELDHEGTSLHPHGLKDHEFAIDGVTFLSQDPIAPGEVMDHTFVAGEESVATYHSHHMSLHQVPNGLFGAMIIGDYAALAGIDGVVAEEVMILNDAGNIGFSLNGKSFPATEPYVYSVGDRVLVHYANEGQMAHPMHLHNQTGTVIAKDGYLLPEGARYQGDTFNVAPGERLSVVYEMSRPGTWAWHCHILSHVKRADGTMFGMLTAVIVEE